MADGWLRGVGGGRDGQAMSGRGRLTGAGEDGCG